MGFIRLGLILFFSLATSIHRLCGGSELKKPRMPPFKPTILFLKLSSIILICIKSKLNIIIICRYYTVMRFTNFLENEMFLIFYSFTSISYQLAQHYPYVCLFSKLNLKVKVLTPWPILVYIYDNIALILKSLVCFGAPYMVPKRLSHCWLKRKLNLFLFYLSTYR